MSRTLLGLLIVVAVAELGARALEEKLPVLSEWPTLETEIKSAQLDELGETPSLLIVGTSTLESAVDPAQLVTMGSVPEAYNSAFPFYSPAAAEVWLNKHVDPWGEIEFLLVGVPAVPGPANPSDYSLADKLTSMSADSGTTNPLDRLALWRLRGVLTNLDEAVRRDKARANQFWTDLGHQTFYYGRVAEPDAGVLQPLAAPDMETNQSDALRRIVERAHTAGATPVIVIEPGRFPDPANAQTVAERVEWLRTFAAELDAELWDTYSVGWDTDFYADAVHFNQHGAQAYTAYLGELIEELLARP